jgi:hypothetical protein
MHVHRVDGDVDYFYVANARHAENRRINPVSQDVWFTTTAADSVPYLMNAWTGDVRRLAVFERDGARVRVRISLKLGTLFDIVRVTVNGNRLDPSTPLAPLVDLGSRLRPGSNTITIEMPTTLFNRLRTTNSSVFGSSSRQAYGLVGLVSIKPYREAVVA